MRLSVSVLLLLLATDCAAPIEPASEPATPAEIVRNQMKAVMASQRLPSVCVAVVVKGRTELEECLGLADVAKEVKATPATRYALASLTKPLTATGLMTLVEKKLVDLDRPINDYLGDAKLAAYVGDVSGATVRRVLQCTSGLPEHVNIFYTDEPTRRPPIEQSIRRYGFLATAPGEVYTYSNFGYGVIEHVIERVSGQEYAAFMKAKVFDPLGMTSTAILTAPPEEGTVAVKYGGSRLPLAFSDYDHRGASAAYGSVQDLVRLARFVMKERLPDQAAVLRNGSIDRMLGSTDPAVTSGGLLRLGWTVLEHEGYRLIHGSGGMPGAASRLDIVPEARLICAVVANTATANLWDITRSVFAAYLKGYAAKTTAPKPDVAPIRPFSPPPSLIGVWTGNVKTYEGDLPARLEVTSATVNLQLAGRTLPVISIPPGLVDWKLGFESQTLTAPFRGRLGTSDTARAPHVLYAVLKFRGDRLNGYLLAAAVDMKFALPHWIELHPVK